MPSLAEHCAQATRTFGQPFTKVHEWLDACHDLRGYGGVAHRRKRHHLAGVREIARMYGPQAARAAHQHIVADLEQIGWKGPFPCNERHCEQLGLWVAR